MIAGSNLCGLLWQRSSPFWAPRPLSATPECQESSWRWHLILAIYFCACPSATDKMLLSVELMCWNGECQCQVVSAIGYLHSWPRKGAWNQERKGALDGFALPDLDRTWNCYLVTEAARQVGLFLGLLQKKNKRCSCCILVPSCTTLYSLQGTSTFILLWLLSTYYVLGITLDSGETVENKTDPAPAHIELLAGGGTNTHK